MSELAEPQLVGKHAVLRSSLADLGRVVVAFSGGVDSSLVLKVALDTLGRDNVLAATGVSASLAASELTHARDLAQSIGSHITLVETAEIADGRYVANGPDRCYFCKSELYVKLSALARAGEYSAVVNGVNADDARDHVHGIRAAREHSVRQPLADAALAKADVRALARQLGLSNWDKPALACLSSRVAYGVPVTIESLSKIERAEAFIRERGFRNFRVRHHEKLARVEVQPVDLARVCEQPLRDELVAHLKSLGYAYVTVDLQGFRSGSANEAV